MSFIRSHKKETPNSAHCPKRLFFHSERAVDSVFICAGTRRSINSRRWSFFFFFAFCLSVLILSPPHSALPAFLPSPPSPLYIIPCSNNHTAASTPSHSRMRRSTTSSHNSLTRCFPVVRTWLEYCSFWYLFFWLLVSVGVCHPLHRCVCADPP